MVAIFGNIIYKNLMDKKEINFYFKIVIKALVSVGILLVIIILINGFIKTEKIEWKEFIEFISFCLILILIINPKLSIKVPGVFEIRNELSQVEKQLSAVAKNISNIKINIQNENINWPSIGEYTGSAESDASTINFIPEENDSLTKEINKID
jgi:hypothetical protein